MASACDSEVLMVSVVHGAHAYNVAVAVSYELSVQDVVVRGEGVVGPSCRAIVGKDLTAVVSHLVKPSYDSDYVGDLVVTAYLGSGATRTHTLKNMVSRGFAYEFNRESPPAMYRQSFAHVGPMKVNSIGVADTTNVTVA